MLLSLLSYSCEFRVDICCLVTMTPLTTRMHCWPSKLQESHKYVTKQKERYLAAVDKALAVSAKKTALALELDQDTTDERRLWMRTALVRV